MPSEEALAGALLGCAIGDALGLPAEGMRSSTIARRFGSLDRFSLLGRVGFVSDDTEQSALVAEAIALARSRDGSLDVAVAHFRRRLAGWFLRLPFGIGLATLRACVKILLGISRSGVRSAGNGAAMRAAIIGVALKDDEGARRSLGRALAAITHTDARAIEGALFVAELASIVTNAPDVERANAARRAAEVIVEATTLKDAVVRAIALAQAGEKDIDAARELGATGFILHTVPLVTFMFVKHGADPMAAIRATIAVGGDTDTNAAIVGALVGAQHGVSSLPAALIERLQPGPFGGTHLRALARALASGGPPPSWSSWLALARNLALYPVILAHGFRRLIPM